jgi:orotate phosphoribosyltransferase
MTITDEAAAALARDEAAVTLARETIALLREAVALLRDLAARNEATAEWAADMLAGRTMAPVPVAYALIDATRLTAAYARGKAATR